MGVSEVTAEIAATILREKSPLSPPESYLLWILTGMPRFRDIRRFDLFETAYMQVAPDEIVSSTENLIDAVYWLGADCFYGAYDPESTKKYYYDHLMPLLAAHGVKPPLNPDLSTW